MQETKVEVFQMSLVVERHHLRPSLRAILGTILFHRVCGQLRPATFEYLGISFPVPAEGDAEALLDGKCDAFAHAILDQPTTTEDSLRAKVDVALYPVPLPRLASRSPNRRSSLPSSSARSSSPTVQGSSTSRTRTRDPSYPRKTSLAAHPAAAVSSALGWLASARAALGGDSSGVEATTRDEEDEEVRFARELQAKGKGAWEGWSIDLEVVADNPRGSGRDEKLQAQLNDFLLRSLSFVMHNNAHIPPITSSEAMPHGVLILLDSPSRPFIVPKPVFKEVEGFPNLHRTLVAGNSGRATERRSTAAAGAGW
ncbi:hypothetical protein JCM10212_004048 [Sporobolomyces blumeae]